MATWFLILQLTSYGGRQWSHPVMMPGPFVNEEDCQKSGDSAYGSRGSNLGVVGWICVKR